MGSVDLDKPTSRECSVWFLVGTVEKTLRSAANLKIRATANHLNGIMSADLSFRYYAVQLKNSKIKLPTNATGRIK